MDNIRKNIIQQLDKTPSMQQDWYLTDLVSCLNTVSEQCGEKHKMLNMWFKGVIESLYYRPNKYVLVLEGKGGIGKSEFFRHLLPENVYFKYSDSYYAHEIKKYAYNCLLIDLVFEKHMLNIPTEENFIVEPFCGTSDVPGERRYASTNKRLASYCSTTNKWQYPPRKNFIVLKLESINQELFNSIDKLQLWIEIFNKFKPEGK